MKQLYISIFFFLTTQFVLPQIDVIDISPDGKNRVAHQINNEKDYGRILAALQDVPYGTTPSWSAMRERQCATLAFRENRIWRSNIAYLWTSEGWL